MVKQCLECGGEVERWERTCPHCGSPQKSLATRILLGIILIGAGFVVWQILFPKTNELKFKPGTPVLTRPSSPVCASDDLLNKYIFLSAKEDRLSTDNLLVNGCAMLREDVPLTVLKQLDSGATLVQGFPQGHASNFWISSLDLKPYRTKR